MKRLHIHLALCAGVVFAAMFASPALGASKSCSENAFFCAETAESIGYNGEYTGNSEVLFSTRIGILAIPLFGWLSAATASEPHSPSRFSR